MRKQCYVVLVDLTPQRNGHWIKTPQITSLTALQSTQTAAGQEGRCSSCGTTDPALHFPALLEILLPTPYNSLVPLLRFKRTMGISNYSFANGLGFDISISLPDLMFIQLTTTIGAVTGVGPAVLLPPGRPLRSENA